MRTRDNIFNWDGDYMENEMKINTRVLIGQELGEIYFIIQGFINNKWQSYPNSHYRGNYFVNKKLKELLKYNINNVRKSKKSDLIRFKIEDNIYVYINDYSLIKEYPELKSINKIVLKHQIRKKIGECCSLKRSNYISRENINKIIFASSISLGVVSSIFSTSDNSTYMANSWESKLMNNILNYDNQNITDNNLLIEGNLRNKIDKADIKENFLQINSKPYNYDKLTTDDYSINSEVVLKNKLKNIEVNSEESVNINVNNKVNYSANNENNVDIDDRENIDVSSKNEFSENNDINISVNEKSESNVNSKSNVYNNIDSKNFEKQEITIDNKYHVQNDIENMIDKFSQMYFMDYDCVENIYINNYDEITSSDNVELSLLSKVRDEFYSDSSIDKTPIITDKNSSEKEACIIDIAKNIYKVDDIEQYAILLAIYRLETGNGESRRCVYDNNPGGLRSGNSFMTFKTFEIGAECFVRNVLRIENLALENYPNSEDILSAMQKIYCEENIEWTNETRKIKDSILANNDIDLYLDVDPKEYSLKK